MELRVAAYNNRNKVSGITGPEKQERSGCSGALGAACRYADAAGKELGKTASLGNPPSDEDRKGIQVERNVETDTARNALTHSHAGARAAHAPGTRLL